MKSSSFQKWIMKTAGSFSLPKTISKPAKESRKSYILAYSIFFLLFASVIITVYALSGKSFIWGPNADGMRQHYICLAYYGEFLRQLPSKIFLEHTLPMWDLHIGYGSDILTTLHYYTIGDPLNLLSAFVPAPYTEYLYNFLLILRMYLAGGAFSLYCKSRGCKNDATLCGSMLYVFSGWILLCGLKHPFFINPCIYFPLLLLGVEKIYHKKTPWLYTCMVAVSAMSNFYFFYMLGILTIFYAIFRYFSLFSKRSFRSVMGWLFRFAIYSLASILLAMPVFLPVLGAFLETGRLNADTYLPAHYSIQYYLGLFPALFGKYQSHHTIIGVSVISFGGILALFLGKGRKALKLSIFFLLTLLAIPFGGHIMNGFSYATNRYSWAMVMLLCFLFARIYPAIFRFSRKKHLLLSGGFFLYGIYVAAIPAVQNPWTVSTAVIACCIGVLLILLRLPLRKKRVLRFAFTMTAAAAGIFTNMYFLFTPAGNPLSCAEAFVDSEKAYETALDPISREMQNLPAAEDYRVEQMGTPIQYNASLLTKLSGTQYFFSMVDKTLNQYQQETGFNRPYEQRMQNLNDRAFLMKLASVRYFAGQEKYIPYGFQERKKLLLSNEGSGAKTYSLCEDENALPFAYTYDSYIPKSTYDNMHIAARQQAMLQGAVLSDSSLPLCEPEDLSRFLPYQVIDRKGLTVEGNTITVTKPKASLRLSFQGLPQCETYVIFENLLYEGVTDAAGKSETETTISLRGRGRNIRSSRVISLVSKKNNYYSNRTDFTGNLGYQEGAFSCIDLVFSKPGRYSFESINVCCQPMEKLNLYAAERREDIQELPVFSDNQVTLSVSLDQPKAVVFSIPYSKGWTAWVNGEKVPLKQANTLYMAVEAPAGENQIQLKYQTPYLVPGLLFGAGGWIFIFLLVKLRRLKK